jgi:hypothetical protein
MYLTVTNLASYLAGRGLVELDSVVDGDFAVQEAGRRNRNFKVSRGVLPGLFVKQVANTASWEPIVTVHREAAFYKEISSRPPLAPVAKLTPRLVDFNPAHVCLVSELVENGENYNEYHHRIGAFPEMPAEILGRGMAAYHSLPPQALADLLARGVLPGQVPWILSLNPATLSPLGEMPQIGPMMLAVLPQYPALLHTLLALRYEWVFDSLIHGDMKWDNLVVSEEGDEPQLRVVDWELADIGDAAWDAGAVIAAYIGAWMLMLSASGTSPAEVPTRFAEMRQALRAFWTTYAATRGLQAVARPYLERCMRFAAARLALTVFEFLYGAPQMTPLLLAMLQTGQGMTSNPGQAASEMLGL